MSGGEAEPHTHTLSVVVPVYRGETTLEKLAAELAQYREPFTTPDGHRARIGELLLVHDCGPDRSDVVIRALAAERDWVRPVWLSRNYGQHAATLAGIASSGGDWVVTMDEDGQHDPACLGLLLDRALAADADVVYARPTNPPPHGAFRNASSRLAKASVGFLAGNEETAHFNSLRLMLGEIARSVAAYAGSGAYLDVALGWVSRRTTTCPVQLREEWDRPSGYRFRSLMSHYWRMVLTSGTRLLRMVSIAGAVIALAGFGFALFVIIARVLGSFPVQGWASVMVVVLVTTGALLFALGVVAEYVGVAVNMAMGKPPYLIVADRESGPHGWTTRRDDGRV